MSFVKYEQKDQVAVLTIDRPEALNALNTQVLCDLDEAIAKVEQADDVPGGHPHRRGPFFCGGRRHRGDEGLFRH